MMPLEDQDVENSGASARTGIAGLIPDMARRLAAPHFPTGDHAALRRMDPRSPGGAAIPLFGLLETVGVSLSGNLEVTQRWALIVQCLALVRGRHDRRNAAGKGLLEIGLSETRLDQLLSADSAVLFDLLPRIARRIAAQSVALDWVPLAKLALWTGDKEDLAEEARLAIARSFARAQGAKT